MVLKMLWIQDSRNSSDSGDLENWQSWAGKSVPRSLAPGYVVASFFISYIGAWTTLELLNRRSANKGWYNWSLLACASITMGGIAVWSMHFIGNRAIILGDGQIQLQLVYDPLLTTISFFMPIVVLFVAFAAVGTSDKFNLSRLLLGGTLAGFGALGMHYLGQASIVNYDCIYSVGNVVGAALVAIAACIVALGVFFILNKAWNASWWKRGVCASILAGAVTGMHWLASTGTVYQLRKGVPSGSNGSRTATTAAVIVLSFGGCSSLFCVALFTTAKKLRAARKARQVVLATAVFDLDGKLMVTTGGLLPAKKITNSFLEQSVDDAFSTTHPTFLWIFRMTSNWRSISSLIPAMRDHLTNSGMRTRFGTENSATYINEQGTPIKNYSFIFRELFCTAAADLAADLHEPLEDSGIMFDEIIRTGQPAQVHSKGSGGRASFVVVDIEGGGMGKGQLLFLVRIADRVHAERLIKVGYRFAPIPSVVPLLAATFQIPRGDFTRYMEIMRDYGADVHILEPGVHLAFFAVRASMGAGFDILARKDSRNQLPTMQLPFDYLEEWQVEFLQTMDAFDVAMMLKYLAGTTQAAKTSRDRFFAHQLRVTLETLKEEIDDPLFNDASLNAKSVLAPCRGEADSSTPGSATLIAFSMVVPIHARAPGKKLVYRPLNFFKLQQHCYKNSPDHDIFAKRVYREFASELGLASRSNVHHPPKTPFVRGSKRSAEKGNGKEQEVTDYFGNVMVQALPISPPTEAPRRPSIMGTVFNRRGSRRADNASEQNLIDNMSGQDQPFNVIPESSEARVNAKDSGVGGNAGSLSPVNNGTMSPGQIEMGQLKPPSSPNPPQTPSSLHSAETIDDGELPSYVDELFKACIQRRK